MVITVKDFQAIGHAALVAEGLTVIVGPSDRGKSALLRAVEAGLFNRTGDGFVRVGRTAARVQLVLDGGARHDIAWEKGGGVNRFLVDGVEYGRVGRDAPPILRELGFRDELIGARVIDDGTTLGGALMRPQVARQFDGPFLLDQSGSFVNETMVKLSRLGVLQRANRACSSDLRGAKQRLGAQQELALTYRAAADKLQPVVALRARVETLAQMAVDVEAAETKLAALKTLVAQRATIRPLAETILPVREPMEPTIRRGLVTATLRAYVTQRAAAWSSFAVDLPPAATRPEKRWWKRGESLGLLAPLLADRRRVLARTGVLPPPRALDPAVRERGRLYPTLWALTVNRRSLVGLAAAMEAQVAQWTTACVESDMALTALKRELKVCPMCDRPFAAVFA
jgi:hypothetical protein